MELRHLRYFVAVAEALHFSRAAERLHVTQPALSRQIRDLEDELGVALLRRHRTETRLTPAGARFLVQARDILTAAGRAIADARTAGRRLRVGHYGALWTEAFSRGWRMFARQHPDRSLELVELTPVELVTALRRQELDLALIGSLEPAWRREFATQRLCTVEALVAVAADGPYAKHRRLALSDLRDAPWIGWDEASFPGRTQLLREAAGQAGFSPRLIGTVDSVASMFVAITTRGAAGYVLPMSRRLPHAGIGFASLRPAGITFEMHAAWLRGARDAALLEELADTLRQTAQPEGNTRPRAGGGRESVR